MSDHKVVIADFGNVIEMDPHVKRIYPDLNYNVCPEKLYHRMYSKLEFQSVWEEDLEYPDIQHGLPTYKGGNTILMENYIAGILMINVIMFDHVELWRNNISRIQSKSFTSYEEFRVLNILNRCELEGSYELLINYYDGIPKGLENDFFDVLKVLKTRPEQREKNFLYMTKETNYIENKKSYNLIDNPSPELIERFSEIYGENNEYNRSIFTSTMLLRNYKQRNPKTKITNDILKIFLWISSMYESDSIEELKLQKNHDEIIYEILTKDIINTLPYNHCTNVDMLRNIFKFAIYENGNINSKIDSLGGYYNSIKFRINIQDIIKQKEL